MGQLVIHSAFEGKLTADKHQEVVDRVEEVVLDVVGEDRHAATVGESGAEPGDFPLTADAWPDSR